ncbi:SPOR domain-containing protein [Alloalcanivorax mobilis]|uniref:SPOR domain-containing protein n=1 Tax=Alloalcanivorax mobilis TaxID=2019569 RepID=UPI000C77DADC|nr:SPOR domain-containing protein [Alloalcanivorax mobilis]
MAKNTPRRGASRGPTRKKTSQRQVPGWVWMFTGLAAGLFVAFLVHLGKVQMDQGGERARPVAKQPAQKASTDKPHQQAADDSKDDQPKFDFYAVLPKMEVIVPKGEGEDSNSAGKAPPTATDNKGAGANTPVAGRHDERFLLQAGSFRNRADADRRRAELTLKGYDVSIQPVKLESGDTWHRVMIGPYDNVNALHRAQDKLVTAGVETLPIQVKK